MELELTSKANKVIYALYKDYKKKTEIWKIQQHGNVNRRLKRISKAGISKMGVPRF